MQAMKKNTNHNSHLKGIVVLARLIRLAMLLGAIPLGIVGLIEGFASSRESFLSQQPALSSISLGWTAFGGILILAAILVTLLVIALETRIRFYLRDEEYSTRAQGSINRLKDWMPKEPENS